MVLRRQAVRESLTNFQAWTSRTPACIFAMLTPTIPGGGRWLYCVRETSCLCSLKVELNDLSLIEITKRPRPESNIPTPVQQSPRGRT